MMCQQPLSLAQGVAGSGERLTGDHVASAQKGSWVVQQQVQGYRVPHVFRSLMAAACPHAPSAMHTAEPGTMARRWTCGRRACCCL